MLADAEARGLSGAAVNRVRFQAAFEGAPLDDVVVEGRRADGTQAVLQIQAKRTVRFSPQDSVFREVVQQIARAVKDPDRLEAELAVALDRTSSKISGPYQDVLA